MEQYSISLPGQVDYIIEKLAGHGHEAYAVGGCVRDTLLGREPGDWDITTSASPAEIKSIFSRTIDTGIAHGTVTVMVDRCGYEVTTYRIDGKYEDGRHPSSVEFTKNLLEDLKRRDFTINAMAYNKESGLIDSFDGIGDLNRKRIRCVGDAGERFREDSLRMLRAVRFAAQLGFTIEKSTGEAIRTLAPGLSRVSRERIQAELTKLLLSPNPQEAEKLFAYGLAGEISPQLAESFQKADTERMLGRLAETERDAILRYTVFLSILEGTPAQRRERTGCFLKELRFDNHTIEYVSRLSEHQDCRLSCELPLLRRQIVEMGEDIFPYLLKLQGAEHQAQLYARMKERGDCLSIKELAVDGNDLIKAGIKPGRELGEKLKELLYLVLDMPERNKREELLGYLAQMPR